MSVSDVYCRYAAECLKYAEEATSDDNRKAFVDMARTWMTAAMEIDASVTVPDIVARVTKPKSAA